MLWQQGQGRGRANVLEAVCRYIFSQRHYEQKKVNMQRPPPLLVSPEDIFFLSFHLP